MQDFGFAQIQSKTIKIQSNLPKICNKTWLYKWPEKTRDEKRRSRKQETLEI